MTETEAHLVRMLYELTELVYYSMPDGLAKKRLVEMRKNIRQDYDESIWKDMPLRRTPEEAVTE